MSNQPTTLLLEIPSDVTQQEVWDFEERLRQVESVKIDLQEPRDFITPTHLFIHFIVTHLGQLAAISGGIKGTSDIAKIIYDFLHPAGKEKTDTQGKKDVVIITLGKRIDLYNRSTEEIKKEIEKVLEEQ